MTRDDWKRKPLPEKRMTLPLGRAYSVEEYSLIRRGLVPQQVADQWFIYHEGDVLFFHRSYTGYCIYVVHFHDTGQEIRATYADVNRDPEQYRETDDQRDREMVLELIQVLLVQRPLHLCCGGLTCSTPPCPACRQPREINPTVDGDRGT